MAVVSAQHVLPTQGGIDSPAWSGDLYSFVFIEQPGESEAGQSPGNAAPTTHWPVSTAPRTLSGQRMRAHIDDWYYRVHISPQRADLGNLVSTQVFPVTLWNAYLEPRTLDAIGGLGEGIQVSGQPAPPLAFAAIQERTWQLSVTPDGEPVLDTEITWSFENGAQVGIEVTANRIVAWSFAPDWGDSITERLSSLTDILASDTGVEQRRALRLAPRREFEAQMYAEGRERQMLDLALFGWGTRIWALPIWPDIQLLQQPLPAASFRIACSTAYLDFQVGGMAMIRGESALVYEVVQILDIDAGGIDLVRSTQRDWPVGSRLYPARAAQLMERPALTRLTDRAQGAQVHFLVVEVSDWPELLPSAVYRGRPVLEARPDEGNDLTSSMEASLSQLDSGLAIPLTTDLADRAFPVTGYGWLEMGRAARAAWRSMVYALRGRQAAMWVPTHADDLTLVAQVADVATTLDVANIGYTRFGQARPGRRDIRIELFDGSIFYRRITNATELDQDIERIAIDSALGRLVLPSQVARICWMTYSRGNSDTVEIEHITDSEGVASSSLTFRGVRDDEF
ncbi:hypothetical protein [Pseudomonas citronellolis]|uniref:hypothetical protein n=1 Tax=Pseudomonas citronellolis TaxID=53408 RepID=UPI0023E443FF|nr:hypothetical protein [Pseudomonas citronellolis]MDF3932929.1 hypothetical protein [Pseudomonas citronellolis]